MATAYPLLVSMVILPRILVIRVPELLSGAARPVQATVTGDDAHETSGQVIPNDHA